MDQFKGKTAFVTGGASGIGLALCRVSVLCPSWVKTRMLDNGRNRPARFGGPIALDLGGGNAERNRRYAQALANGLDPAEVARLVLDAIEARRLYIFTHAISRDDIERRFEAMMEGFQALAEEAAEPGPWAAGRLERR
jgi:NAD(P)-dependent dehydrogenase (short-subunit alcohol dehydrogenase family)